MEFSRTRDPAWRREGAEGRILAESERVFPKSGASLTEDGRNKNPRQRKGVNGGAKISRLEKNVSVRTVRSRPGGSAYGTYRTIY